VSDVVGESGPLYVLADTYQLARRYAEIDRQLGPDHGRQRPGVRPGWRYVDGWRAVQGRAPGRYAVVTIGRVSALEEARRAELVAYLDAHGWRQEA
jgi:hypothetical protein